MVSKGRARLERQFDRLQRSIPDWAARPIVQLRKPALWIVRIPLGILLIIGGILSFLPVLGIWMLPLGLLLLAIDVPALQTPVTLSSILLQRKIQLMRRKRRQRAQAAAE